MTNPARTQLLLAVVAAAGGLVACAEDRLVPLASAPRPEATGSTAALVAPHLGPAGAPPTTQGTVGTLPTVDAAGAPATTTVDAVAPAAVIDGGPKGLAAGAKGAAVAALEGRLQALRFNPGPGDGTYDRQLTMAVMAFQKQQDLPRTGRADPTTLARMATAGLGTGMVAAGEATRVEIDLKRQIVQFWKDGRLVRVLAVSTGNGEHYCVPAHKGGGCDTAITPGGSFRADRKIQGVRVSALGTLYDPVYFYGGIALHGSPSIPASPASHGCVRVAMWESAWVYNNVNIGDPVYVVGGKTAPVPFGESAPVEVPDEVTVPPASSAA